MFFRSRSFAKLSFLLIWGIFVCGLIVAVNSQPSIKRFVVLSTSRLPQKLTELYFVDHLHLPKYINDQDSYSFTFAVHNLENVSRTYRYRVYKVVSDQSILISEGQVSLTNGQTSEISQTIGPLEYVRTKIVVELVDYSQSISFWLEAT